VIHDPETTEYPINSYVLYTPPTGRRNKFAPRDRGPFQVMERRESIYVIEDLINGKRIKTHIHNFRQFIYDPAYVNPTKIAQQNEQEFVVEQMLAHRGDHHRWSTMEF